jgi:hypothetical protein
MNTFKKIDIRVLKTYPKLWITGAHFIIPAIILLTIIAFVVGISMKFNFQSLGDPNLDWQKLSQAKTIIGLIRLLLGLLVIAITIYFVSRQIKYINIRIHHRVPYSDFLFFYLINVFVIYALFYGVIALDYGVNLSNPEQREYLTSFLKTSYLNVLSMSLSLGGVLYMICATSKGNFGAAVVRSFLLIPIISIIGLFFVLIFEKLLNFDSLEDFLPRFLAILVFLFLLWKGFLSKKSHDKKVTWALVLYFVSIPILLSLLGFDVWDKIRRNELMWLISTFVVLNTFIFNEIFKRKIAYPKDNM